MAISGALIGKAIGSFGSKPKIPAFKEISPDAIQSSTVTGNIASLADISRLAAGVDTFNQSQLESLIDRVLPGARQQIQENINSQLQGEIPKDVLRNLRRSQAERGAGALTGGSQFNLGQELSKQLGLSLELTNQGLASAERWLAQSTAPRFDVTSMFFTPQQRYGYAVNERDARLQRDLLAAQVKAAPDPATAALGTEIDRFFNTAAGAGMMAAGGGFGGGGAAAGAAGGGGGLGSFMGGGGGFGGTGSFSNMGLAGGQGVGIGQSSMGNFYGNWNKKFGF